MATRLDVLEVRELDARAGDGIAVRLLWRPSVDRVYLDLRDGRSGEQFLVAVAGADALDAFRHPFAYLNSSAPGRADAFADDSFREGVRT
jgi:hypothetical protein